MCFVMPADFIQSLRYKGSKACVIPLNTCPVERSPQRARASSDNGNTASVLVFLVTICIHQPPSADLMMFSHCRRMMSLMRNPVRQENRAADLQQVSRKACPQASSPRQVSGTHALCWLPWRVSAVGRCSPLSAFPRRLAQDTFQFVQVVVGGGCHHLAFVLRCKREHIGEKSLAVFTVKSSKVQLPPQYFSKCL